MTKCKICGDPSHWDLCAHCKYMDERIDAIYEKDEERAWDYLERKLDELTQWRPEKDGEVSQS